MRETYEAKERSKIGLTETEFWLFHSKEEAVAQMEELKLINNNTNLISSNTRAISTNVGLIGGNTKLIGGNLKLINRNLIVSVLLGINIVILYFIK